MDGALTAQYLDILGALHALGQAARPGDQGSLQQHFYTFLSPKQCASDPCHFDTDPNPWIRIRLRIMLFFGTGFQDANKK
jgi:hypothetical protein